MPINSRILTRLMVILVVVLHGLSFAHEYQEIHCKHFFFGYPTGTPSTNDLIIRDGYALSSNDKTKFADWVVYRLDIDTISGDAKLERKWTADPWLDDEETLEPRDYIGIGGLNMDRGHQAPLASFKGTRHADETNYLSNITPQRSSLNQGAWVKVENKERELVKKGHIIYVMTGPLYEMDEPKLPNADEPHQTPSGYWKIIVTKTGRSFDSIIAASFIFNQSTERQEKVLNHLTTINEIEKRSGLDFLRELPDDIEERIEANRFSEWAIKHF